MARNNLFGAVSNFFGDVVRAQQASRLYSELQSFTDEDLAARGLNRHNIASYVMKTNFPS